MMTTTAAPTGGIRQIGSPAIVARGLTKRFGAVTAVQDLSFEVRPGKVTGFLGRTSKLRSCTAVTAPNRFVSPRATMAGLAISRVAPSGAVVMVIIVVASFA